MPEQSEHGASRTNREVRFVLSLVVIIFLAITSNADAFRKSRVAQNENYSRTEEQVDRLRRVMLPLLRVSNLRTGPDAIRVSIVDDAVPRAAAIDNIT